jgi:hypothetical protein
VFGNPSRATQSHERSRPSRSPLALRALAALLLSLGLLLAGAACGNDYQTLRPYTPAEGVNVDVGDPADTRNQVHVRNLLIISKAPGEGIVSGSLLTDGRDQLSGITGVPIKADGSEGAPFTATLSNTVSMANGALVVLTDGAPITVRSPDLAAGLTARLTLTFAKAGEVTVIVPVMDGNEPQYAAISPEPTPSA